MAHVPRVLRLALVLSAVLCLPSLVCGFLADDNLQITVIEGTQKNLGSAPFDLYNFGTGQTAQVHAAVEQGVVPWFTHPQMKVRLFRPLSSALIVLDHQLFGRNAVPYHLHQILWYVGLVGVVGLFHRRVLPGVTGGLALLLFAIDDAHAQPVGWLASRHAILSALPAVLGLIAYFRFRDDGWRPGRWLCLPAFALGLLSGEGALGVMAYLVAYELVGAKDSLSTRAAALTPPALLVLVYLAWYKLHGFGAANSGAYVDPLGEPVRFTTLAMTRIPTLAFDLFGGMSAEMSFLHPALAPFIIGGGVITLGIVGLLLRALYPSFSEEERRAARVLPLGAFLALLPALSGFVGARVLLPASIGGAGILALVIRYGWLAAKRGAPTGRYVRGMCTWYAFMHIVIAPLAFLTSLGALTYFRTATESALVKAGLSHSKDRDIFVLSSSDPMMGFYGGMALFAEEGARIHSCHLLSMARFDHDVVRTGPMSFELQVVGGRMLDAVYEGVFRGEIPPFAQGDEVALGDSKVRVVALRDGKPSRIEVTTARPLEDPRYAFVTWQNGALEPVTFPKQGETAHFHWSAGPMGL